jgi:hypothetical protein
MQLGAVQTSDPVRACWDRCLAIHPLHLEHLCATFIDALAAAAGLDRGSQVFAALRYAVTWQDLARIPWGSVSEQLRAGTVLPAAQLEGVVECVRLLAARAVLHHRLYLAQSGTTLLLLRKCFLPQALPLELIGYAVEFHRHLKKMDEVLRTGRASLDRFGRQALLGEPVAALRTILEQAQACAEAYRSAYNEAYQIAEGVDEYLAWRTSRQEGNAARREDQAGSQQPAARAAIPASPHGSDPRREGRSPASKAGARATRGGGFATMPDEPVSELLAFCAACPPPREVLAALAEIHFKLAFTMEEQRFSASLKTPPVPAQYHFRDAHGTEVIYLAGEDVGEEGESLPSHASRFWLYPGTDAAAAHLAAQFCATKWPLTWRRTPKEQQSEAVA